MALISRARSLTRLADSVRGILPAGFSSPGRDFRTGSRPVVSQPVTHMADPGIVAAGDAAHRPGGHFDSAFETLTTSEAFLACGRHSAVKEMNDSLETSERLSSGRLLRRTPIRPLQVQGISAGKSAGGSESPARIDRSFSGAFRFALKVKNRILFVDASEVSAVEAQGSYVLLHWQSLTVRVRGSIAALAEELEQCGFVRIHRSTLVNASCVAEMRLTAGGEHTLRVCGGKEYPVSRTYRGNVKSLAKVWIGVTAIRGY